MSATSRKFAARWTLPPISEDYRGVLLDELKQRGESMGRAITTGHNGDLALSLTLFAAHYSYAHHQQRMREAGLD